MMTTGNRWLAALAAGGLVALSAPKTEAFCGFYVSGADGKLFNNATEVVLMREGTRTVLSMQNSYQGPPEDFAMVVPVPVVLQKESVKTLPSDVFERVDKLTAPRLVEYWEQDPCPKNQGIGLGSIGTIGGGAGTGTGQGLGGGRAEASVKIEAQFEVGEYEIVILSASDSVGLDGWLHEHHYKIPDGAEPALRPYVQSGWKFFVARVDPKKVSFEKGRATLSPLRFHYDADTFSLPVRLGLLNSPGTQDLIVHVLSPKERYEVANFPNVTIPTNLDVSEAARPRFGTFYATLFDKTLEKNPGAVVTEYAWESSSCDPCPTPPLNALDLATLGADELPSTAGKVMGAAPRALATTGKVTAKGLPPDVATRVLRMSATPLLRPCMMEAMQGGTTQEPQLEVALTLGARGEVTRVKAKPGKQADPRLAACAERRLMKASFPAPEGGKGGSVVASLNLSFRAPPSRISFTLTRLHARYDSKSLGEDLVFRAAKPIAGGREFLTEADGGRKLEQGSKLDGRNNFQARYAIRHPWKGAVACKAPRRGVWGGPPSGAAPPPEAARDLAMSPRAAAEFVSFLGAGRGEDDIIRTATLLPGAIVSSPNPPVVTPPASSSAEPAPSASAAPSAAPLAAPPAPPPPPTKGGCAGCQASSAGPTGAVAGVIAALFSALARRRRRAAG
jgi:uncharacterized protein (TIGR03382 family)